MPTSTPVQQPMGVLEIVFDSIKKSNHRLDTLELKLDRIWELVSKLQALSGGTQPEPVSNKQLPLFDDKLMESMEGKEIAIGEPANPDCLDWQNKEAYREYTLDLIVELRNADMTLREIAEELNDMGLKTRTGKDKWSFGIVAGILKQ